MVDFRVPVEVAFDYLADPRNRPEWQPSLRAVELLDEEVAEGQRWIDVTKPGLRPAMRTVELDRPRVWAEVGRWRGVEALVRLRFTATAEGCRVDLEATVSGYGPVGRGLTRIGLFIGARDLKRASRIVSGANDGHAGSR
jgi:hypothetical protein